MNTLIAQSIQTEELCKYLYYDSTSISCLRWAVTKGPKAKKDSIAGTKTPKGYYRVKLHGKVYSVHRLVWQLLNSEIDPLLVINHIDNNPSNNIISNLEVCTRKDNSNRSKAHTGVSLRSNNTSGVNGIHECTNSTNNKYAKVTWYKEGTPHFKLFSYLKLGEDSAWSAAESFRKTLLSST